MAGFAAVMGMLFALEAGQRRWPPPGSSRSAAAALLAARLGLFVAAAALDPSGESRVLLVLVPFAAYFAFGRAASLVLAAVCLTLLVGGFMLRVPHWYTQAAYLSDVLMFAVGLVLAIAMASVAVAALADARSSVRQALGDVRLSVRALREDAAPAALPEMLADLIRAAGPGQPQVTLSVTGYDAALSEARLVVADDGRGFGPACPAGFGLGIRERAALAGGLADIASIPGEGTTVTVTVPRRAPATLAGR